MKILKFALACARAARAPPRRRAWPSKPVTLVNPFAPGGGVDAFGRPLSVILSKNLGSSSSSKTWPAPAARSARPSAAKRRADGYNFFLGAVHHTIAESLYTKLPYSLEKDFVPITVLAYVPNVVVDAPEAHQPQLDQGPDRLRQRPIPAS